MFFTVIIRNVFGESIRNFLLGLKNFLDGNLFVWVHQVAAFKLILRSFHLRFLSVFLCIICKCIHKERRKEYLWWLLSLCKKKNDNYYLSKYNYKRFKVSFLDIMKYLFLKRLLFYLWRKLKQWNRIPK